MAQLTASLDLATKTRNGQVAMKIKLMFKMSQQSNPTNSAAVLAHVEGLIEENNKEILKIQAAIDNLIAKILPTKDQHVGTNVTQQRVSAACLSSVSPEPTASPSPAPAHQATPSPSPAPQFGGYASAE